MEFLQLLPLLPRLVVHTFRSSCQPSRQYRLRSLLQPMVHTLVAAQADLQSSVFALEPLSQESDLDTTRHLHNVLLLAISAA